MSAYIEPIGRLINQFTKLPGVGTKTAQRYAYKVINMTEEEAAEFAECILKAKKEVHYCTSFFDSGSVKINSVPTPSVLMTLICSLCA